MLAVELKREHELTASGEMPPLVMSRPQVLDDLQLDDEALMDRWLRDQARRHHLEIVSGPELPEPPEAEEIENRVGLTY